MKSLTLNSLLALCRVSNLPTVWMNVLCAALLSMSNATALEICLLAFALSCFYCGGMAMNDVCDFEHDRQHQPYRPIVAGRLSHPQALATMVTLFVMGFGSLALTAYPSALLAGLLLLGIIFLYNRYHKQHAFMVLAMAAARWSVYVVVALALANQVTLWVWVAAALQGIYVLLLSVVARLEIHAPQGRYSRPVVPWMLASMPIIDGVLLAILLGTPLWLLVAVVATVLTRWAQRHVRGD